MKNLTARIDHLISLVSQGLGTIGLGAVVAMMLLTTVDVCLRYFFNSPIQGAYELTEYLLVIAVSFSLAYCAVHKGHVRVDLVVSKFSERAQAVIRSLVTILSLGLMILITMQSGIQALIVQSANSYSSVLRIPTYPFVWLLFIGSALFSLVLLRDLYESVARSLKTKRLTWVWLVVGSVVILLLCFAAVWGYQLPWHLDPTTAGLVGLIILVLLIFSGIEIGLAMAVAGFLGMAYISGGEAALGILSLVPYRTFSEYGFSVLPLFILMGYFCFEAGISSDLYQAVRNWTGQLRGGLAMATVGACAGFAAISGSSLATAATMCTVALPEMKRYRYDDALATGCLAAGGTIGILIPPSIPFVVYGIITEQSIGKLLLSGVIPGIIETLLYIGVIYVLCRHNPLLGPPGPSVPLVEKLKGLKNVWVVLCLFVLVIGGMYTGVFSPTEAAGVGCFGAFAFALARGRLSWRSFITSLHETGNTIAMIFVIIAGALIFGYFLSVSRVPSELASTIYGLSINRYVILTLVIVFYIVMGCIMDMMGIVLISVPIFFPLMMKFGFDPIWFGTMVVVLGEIGMITPPVGLNVYVIAGMAKDVPMYTVFKGIIPFLIVDIVLIILLVVFPEIALFLPHMMK